MVPLNLRWGTWGNQGTVILMDPPVWAIVPMDTLQIALNEGERREQREKRHLCRMRFCGGCSASRRLFYLSMSIKKWVKTKCFLKTMVLKWCVTISLYVTACVCQYSTSNLFGQNKRLTFSNSLCNSMKAAPVWHLKCVFLLMLFNVFFSHLWNANLTR